VDVFRKPEENFDEHLGRKRMGAPMDVYGDEKMRLYTRGEGAIFGGNQVKGSPSRSGSKSQLTFLERGGKSCMPSKRKSIGGCLSRQAGPH